MQRPIPILILLMICIDFTSAQIIVAGEVLNRKSRDPVSYANIGVVNTNVGTISNADGTFSILIPADIAGDTLTFSALGYEARTFSIAHLNHNSGNVVFLDEHVFVLRPVVINEIRAPNRTFVLGNASSKGGVIETDTTYAGRSIALLIENAGPGRHKDLRYPVFLEKARLRVYRNNLSSFKFRIRLNEVDSVSGKPGRDILEQSIVVESDMRKGWLDFDLTSYSVQVTGPFFLTFEQILDLEGRTEIADGYRRFILEHPDKVVIDTVVSEGIKTVRKFLKGSGIDLPGTFIGIATPQSVSHNYSCFVRESSFAEWKRVRGILTATVLLSNQRKGTE